MKVDLNGKVALVTGSGDGIGRAIALALARNGASIVVNDLEARGEETREEITELGQQALLVNADVRKRGEVDHLVSEAEREFGGIDILVGNAGVNTPGKRRSPIYEFDETEWHRVIDVDLTGLFHCCRAVTPGMVKRKQGVIVNIASTMGIVPIRKQVPYAAAKAGVINLTRSIALELGPHGIRANAIAPGSTLTRVTRELFYNPEKTGPGRKPPQPRRTGTSRRTRGNRKRGTVSGIVRRFLHYRDCVGCRRRLDSRICKRLVSH